MLWLDGQNLCGTTDHVYFLKVQGHAFSEKQWFKSFQLIKVNAHNQCLGLDQSHTALLPGPGAPRLSSIKMQQILTTAEHLWAES